MPRDAEHPTLSCHFPSPNFQQVVSASEAIMDVGILMITFRKPLGAIADIKKIVSVAFRAELQVRGFHVSLGKMDKPLLLLLFVEVEEVVHF
jgi:hypothetical protein